MVLFRIFTSTTSSIICTVTLNGPVTVSEISEFLEQIFLLNLLISSAAVYPIRVGRTGLENLFLESRKDRGSLT